MKKSSKSKASNSVLSRTPKWSEQDNVVFGELLLEQYVAGNILNGRLKRHMWKDVVSFLNRRLATSYTESMAQIRFKNMKADFRAIYQLSNKSGWGWDDILKLPIASDEIWNEVIQEEPKLARYRRNPFPQFDIFEKICAGNVAIGVDARDGLPSDNEATPFEADGFMESNGISFLDPLEVEDLTNPTMHVNLQQSLNTMGGTSGSKRSSGGTKEKSQRSKRRAGKERLDTLISKQVETSQFLKETINHHGIPTMRDCIIKLDTIEDLTGEGLMAVNDALLADDKNMVTFMMWEGAKLRKWIEHKVATHPVYYSSPVWM